MDLLSFLQDLGTDAAPDVAGFQARGIYLFMCVAVPVVTGLAVGIGLKVLERVFGLEAGRGRR